MDRVVKIGLLLAAMLLMQTAGANAAGDILIPRYTISEAPGKPLLIKEPKMPDLSGYTCLLYTSPSPRDLSTSRMPSSA